MNLVGVYRAGDSWLHRLPAGVKVVALLVVSLGALLITSPWVALGLLAVTVAVLLSSRVDVRVLAGPMRLVLLATIALTAVMWWQRGGGPAVVLAARLLALVLLAWTVSLTTRVTQMRAVIEAALRPLRPLGVDAGRVSLTLALAIRSVPLLVATVRTAQEARLARGQGRSVTALGVPVVVRSVRIAEDLGDALVARGYDPSDP